VLVPVIVFSPVFLIDYTLDVLSLSFTPFLPRTSPTGTHVMCTLNEQVPPFFRTSSPCLAGTFSRAGWLVVIIIITCLLRRLLFPHPKGNGTFDAED
jgi:hypothetical protein